MENSHYLRACRILETLENHGFQARLVGGCVRDFLLKVPVHDFDIATNALPDDVVTIFSQKPFKVIPTGLSHGTVTVVFRQARFEVTTLRVDEKTDGRRAEVAFSNSFQEDASRRDFTINAMYQDRKNQIDDYFSGQQDLTNKIVRFVGDPGTRIKEDYLRILRYYRFRCRLGFGGIPGVDEIIKSNIDGLSQIAIERILSEIFKIFSGNIPKELFEEMRACGVFNQTGLLSLTTRSPLPESFVNLICTRMISTLKKDLELARLAVFCLYDVSARLGERESTDWDVEASEQYLSRFKLSKKDLKKILFFIEGKNILNNPFEPEVRCLEFVDRCDIQGGKNSFRDFYYPLWSLVLDSKDGPNKKTLDNIFKFEISEDNRRLMPMPLNGKHLMAWTGIQSGKEIGVLMEELKERFRNREWTSLQEAQDLVKKLNFKAK